MTEEFASPQGFRDDDEKELEKSQEGGRTDWSEKFWKPKSGDENLIRILPAKGKAKYHLKAGKHFIEHSDRVESFICNRATYQESCVACEEYDRLLKEEKKEAAAEYKSQVRGTFNIIDRTNEEAGVKLWESPPVAVWEFIIGLVLGKSKMNNIAGAEDDPLQGRDLLILYYPKQQPQHMYKLLPDDTTPLGSKKDVAKWLEQAVELLAENVYPKADQEVARIKTFGTVEEREELRKKLREQAQASAPAEKESEKEEEEPEEEDDEVAKAKKVLAEAEAKKKEKEKKKEEEPEDEVAKAERILEEAKAKKKEKAEGKKEEKKEEKKGKETPADIKRKVDEIRKKHKA